MIRLVVATLLLVAGGGFANAAPLRANTRSQQQYAASARQAAYKALDEYVYRDDGMFEVRDLKTSFPSTDGQYNVHLFNFTSQKWLTPADSSVPIWWHILAVIVPQNLDKTLDSSLLFIGGSKNLPTNWLPTASESKIMWAGNIAVSAKSTASVLYQVPNAPVTFPGDPWKHANRTEDSIIAYTWWKYIVTPPAERKPELILEFPMAKAGVKAMDAAQIVIPPLIGGQKINKFTVVGVSKRGWTTWLVGAVEAIRPNCRVIGMMPTVLDAVNVYAFLHRMHRFYGAWTFELYDYIMANITVMLDSEGLHSVFEEVDMWYFLDRLGDIPKMVVSAGGDQFLMPDDHRYFAKELIGNESFFYLVKNADHSLDTALPEVTAAMASFLSSVQYNRVEGALRSGSSQYVSDRPLIESHIDDATGRIYVTTSIAPKSISVIYCDSGLGISKGRRDFRWATVEGTRQLPWVTQGLEDVVMTSPTSFNALVPPPAEGQWRVFTLEMTFDNKYNSNPLMFTVPASVIPVGPDPFPDCDGANCGTEMI